MNWSEIAPVAVTIFLIMDPFGNLPVFNVLLAGLDPRHRALVIARELLIALVILLGFLLAGPVVMAFLGLTQPSLSIAGGVLLFIIGLRMIFTTNSGRMVAERDEDIFIVPLAVPLVAGPSTIAVLLLLSSEDPANLLGWCVALFLAWLGTTVVLVASPYLMNFIGNRGSRALARLMGMILAILATQLLLDGVREFIESLPPYSSV